MPIVIDAKIKSAGALQALTKLKSAVDAINASVSQLNASLGATAAAAGSAAQSMRAMSRQSRPPSGSSSRGRSPNPFAGNPYGGMAYYAQAAANGNPVAARLFGRYAGQFSSMQRNQARAQQFLSRGGTPAAATLLDIVNRTRFAQIGGKMVGMPLGIDIARLLGGAGGSGALGSLLGGGAGGAGVAALSAPLSAAAAALAAFTAAAVAAQAALGAFSRAMVRGGGTPGQARAVTRIGDALGVDLSGVGNGLMGGYGPIAAAMAGVNPFGGPFGDNDYNKKGLAVFDMIRRQRNLSQARRVAEMAGSPDLAGAFLMSPEIAKMLRSSQAGQGSMANMRTAADMNGALAIIKDSFSDLFIAIGAPVLKEAAKAFAAISEALQKMPKGQIESMTRGIFSTLFLVMKWVQTWSRALASIFEGITALIQKIHDLIPAKVRSAIGWDDDNRRAIKENTQATIENTRAVEGITGGGPRAAGAIPGRLHPTTNPHYRSAPYGVL